MKSRRWCTVGNTKKILIAVWIVAIALSSPTFKIMVNSSFNLSVSVNEREYIMNQDNIYPILVNLQCDQGNIYPQLAKCSVQSGQHRS